MATKPRIKIPDSAKTGEIIEVKTLITHVMETGNRKDKDGQPIRRNIINTFVAKFAGKEVFLGGKLKRAEFNQDLSKLWVMRLIFENGFARVIVPNDK